MKILKNRKTIEFTVIPKSNGKDVMTLDFKPAFWTRVALRQHSKLIAELIESVKTELKSEGVIFTPFLWNVKVDMPMFFGVHKILVSPYKSNKED